ncbi:MAG: DUF4340 domain-containing protein [Clostridia bacterium]|nr:DUF4340 domain-containing protein [Clostridia bacterium]
MSAKAKKTNRVRNIIIAAAVIAVLAAAYFAVSALNRPEAPAPVQQQGDMMIAEFDASKIKEIKYTYNGETIDMVFSDVLYKWQLVDDKSYPIKFEIAGSMASAISQIKANRVVEESREHFADYGLDEPYLRIAATYEEGGAEYLIGDYNSMLGGYYFNIVGSDTVYLIPTGLNPFFEYGLLDIADVDTPPVLTDTSVTELKIIADGKELDEEKTAEAAGYFTTMVQSGLKTVGYMKEEADAAKYGLDGGRVFDISFKQAQTMENTDASGETASYTSTVYSDQTAKFTVALSDDGSTAYFTCGSGLVYTVDAAATASVIALADGQ